MIIPYKSIKMKQLVAFLVLFAVFFTPYLLLAGSRWQRADEAKAGLMLRPCVPHNALIYTLNEDEIRTQLSALLSEPARGGIFELPLADGSTRYFRVWRSAMIPAQLAAKYPGISTFTADAVDNPNITAKLDYTLYGFHAIIFDGINISLIDPVENNQPGYYTVHFKKDEVRSPGSMGHCGVTADVSLRQNRSMDVTPKVAMRVSNGYELRAYRLALACDNQYASAVTGLSNPSISQVLSKMITSLNRVDGVYEREFSITMNLVANEDTLIFNAPSGGINGTDIFASINNDAVSCIAANQGLCDERIGNANYDIGHVFTTGAGGYSQIGVVCSPGLKAQSVTGQPQPWGDGFDIDYAAHEMGHEYGAEHPFNDALNGSCSWYTIVPGSAYEPGSGSTIMAYAGVCSPDDLQPHSDPYFHAQSLAEIQSYTMAGYGNTCAVTTPTNNKPVSLPAFTATYSIPYLTPFELTAPAATDSVANASVTYCWEQWNLGDTGKTLVNTHYSGPIFRSYNPVASPVRVFPKISMVLADSLSNAGIEGNQGEKAPDVARYLTFKLSVRDVYLGNGSFLIPDDSIHLDVINTGNGFTVSSQNNADGEYLGNQDIKVNWNVAGSNTSPINADSVDIFQSADGGYTWPYKLGTYPNNGSATVILPDPDTIIHHSRLKVKGTGNVFFNVNKNDFTVYPNSSPGSNIQVYPSPVHSTLHVYCGDHGILQYIICDVLGRVVSRGRIFGDLDLAVIYWARGVYLLKLIDDNNQVTVKKIVVE